MRALHTREPPQEFQEPQLQFKSWVWSVCCLLHNYLYKYLLSHHKWCLRHYKHCRRIDMWHQALGEIWRQHNLQQPLVHTIQLGLAKVKIEIPVMVQALVLELQAVSPV